MSVETITIIIAAAMLAATIVDGLFAVSAWIQRQMDERFEKVDAQISGLRDDLSHIKVAVVCLEGPHPRRILPPH